MGDIGLVAIQHPGIDPASDLPDDELPHRPAGLEFGGPGIEVGEGPGEHDLRQLRVRSDEAADDLDRDLQVTVHNGNRRLLARTGSTGE